MTTTFGSKETEQIRNRIRVKKMPIDIQNVGRRKLRMLNNSQDLGDLQISPSNRLEKLSEKSSDFYSIRINSQWRIIFIWDKGNASETRLPDGYPVHISFAILIPSKIPLKRSLLLF